MRWYKESIVYQIYPRSFKDSNNDGIGDIRGIIEKVDYLKELGINVVWLSPIYDSPLDDNGYDISDYYNILPEYGTLDDFKELLDKLHSRGIKLIMDLVVNHTSDEHPWFIEAKKNKNSKYRDYYFFRKKEEINNWTSFFGGDAWAYNEETDDYYLHLFSKKQPDLNWDNPDVREEVHKILKFWLDLGVDGFRCDVINLISKAKGLPKGRGILPIIRGREHYLNGPNIHKYLQEIKEKVFSKYDMFTVGECVFINPKTALSYIEEGIDELNMIFQFDHMGADNFLVKWFPRKFNLRKLKKAMSKWQYALENKGWNSLYFENHDQPRSINRFGSLEYHKESAKMLATYLLCHQGTPYIYQGQEIGMTNPNFEKLEDYKDIETKNIYHVGRKILKFSHKEMMRRIKLMSRDNARTPMQWDDSIYSGFSKAKPWINVNENYKEINVENNLNNEDSILYYYKNLIKLKRENKTLIYGNYIEHYKNSKSIAVYERNLENEKIVVVASFSKKDKKLKFPYNLSEYSIILSNYKKNEEKLKPYEVRVYIKK
jgi:oligo-1,6-glucosidase